MAYAGKHSVPRALRKDLWRPLCTVLFPEGDQGRHAFQKLREWRRLHEVDWDRSELPKLDKTKLRGPRGHNFKGLPIAASISRVGGPRVQHTDSDLRKRKMICDQKAASIADLAAVLAEQDQVGEANADSIVKTRQALTKLLLPYANLASESQISKLKQQVLDLHSPLPEGQSLDKTERQKRHATDKSLKKDLLFRRHVRDILSSQQQQAESSPDDANTNNTKTNNASRLTHAISTLDATTMWRMHHECLMGQTYEAGIAQEQNELARRIAVRDRRRRAREATAAANSNLARGGEADVVNKVVKPVRKPAEAVPAAAAAAAGPGPGHDATDTPKSPLATVVERVSAYTSGMLATIRRGPPRPFSSKGVEIKWNNPLDAEFAPQWPQDVMHGPMGYARYTAPPAVAKKARLSVQDGLFDVATGRFVGAVKRLDAPHVQRYNREQSWQAEAQAA